MRNYFNAFILFLLLVSCNNQPKQEKSDLFAERKSLAQLTSKKLREASGLAASANNEGLLWTLNDSGNKPEVFLINEKLDVRLTCVLKGVKNRDWEDIAVGPGPKDGVNYLYVGDIGDNLAMHAVKYIYRFEEPVVQGGVEELTITEFDTITFQLPDGKKDTESLMIHPKTKNLYVVSKRENPVYLYSLDYPYNTSDTLTAKKLTSLPFTMAVGADFSADGREVLIKNYKDVYYWNIGDKDVNKALQGQPVMLVYEEEPQGEAITFKRDGSGFYTVSEIIKGEKSYLYFYPRSTSK